MPVLGRQGCQSSRVSIAWQTKFEMPPSQQNEPRINLLVLRTQMVKRIGSERANQYFAHFKGYISSKFSKQELDRLVVLTIGKENIGLHNQIVKAVLKNAIKCQTPPPVTAKAALRPSNGSGKRSGEPCDTTMAILSASPAASTASIQPNGKPFSIPLRKDGGPPTQDRKVNKEKTNLYGLLPLDGKRVGAVDLHRPSKQAAQGAAQHSEADLNRLAKRPRTTPSSLALDISPHDAKAGHFQFKDGYHWDHSLIRAPSGSPFYPGSIRPTTSWSSSIGLAGLNQSLLEKGAGEEFADSEDLPDTQTLHRRMGNLAALEGIEAVDGICAEVLNRGVDAFLKQLIKGCMDVVRAGGAEVHQESPGAMQDGNPVRNVSSSKQPMDGRHALKAGQMGGVDAQVSYALQESPSSSKAQVPILPADAEKQTQEVVSLLDFKAAMELNPQHLGEDWPSQLEKISLRSLK